MKVLLTGGKSGGHFYPVISVAKKLNEIAEQEKIAKLELVYMSDEPYDENLLLQNNIIFKKTYAGKIRRYFSLWNVTDAFKTVLGILKSVWSIFVDFPDVVFSKGGGGSFPAVVAAKIFGIPLVVHESDTIPGKVNKWSGKFAKRIAISFQEAAEQFQEGKTALTGFPVREEFFIPAKLGAEEFLKIEPNLPVILVIGGSQGAKNINDNILDILPELLENYQIIHQCGKKNLKEVKGRSELALEKSTHKTRYHLFDYLNLDSMRMAYGAADIVVSRAGATSIFEIASAGIPSILIPLANSAQGHQKRNAYVYAAKGAGNVIEENNLTPHVLKSEIDLLIKDDGKKAKMKEATKQFITQDAAEKIAREIIALALEHA